VVGERGVVGGQSILDFRFWILDYEEFRNNPKSKIQNLKSKID